jgi:apolipoprotein N-acyltransferase
MKVPDAPSVRSMDARSAWRSARTWTFRAWLAAYGRAGVQAMLTPAWNLDVDVDGVYHSRMAVLRGVEQGFSVIRAARQGMLTVSDPYGQIVAEAPSADAPVATLSAHAPLGGFGTLYGRIGDVFGWACAAIVGLLVFLQRQPSGLRFDRADAGSITA